MRPKIKSCSFRSLLKILPLTLLLALLPSCGAEDGEDGSLRLGAPRRDD